MEIAVTQEEEFLSVKLSGVIDEDNDLAEHIDTIGGPLVAVDLSGVERINSCGLRDWVNWVGALESKGSKLLFVDCSPSIVAQINLVHNFTGSGHIKSLYLPYYCESCNEEHTLLYEAEELAEEQLPPASRCNGCEQFMDFDDMPDAYFAFLSNREQILFSDTLPHAQYLALSQRDVRAKKPAFPLGSTSIPNLEELLDSTTRTDVDPSTEVTDASLQNTARSSALQEAPRRIGRTRLLLAGGALLLFVAALATFVLS